MKNSFVWTAVFLAATYWLWKGAPTGWVALVVAIVALKAAALAALSGYPKSPENINTLLMGVSVRAILALVFVYHGLPKVLNPGATSDMLMFAVGLVEVGGGLMMAMGPKKLRMLAALGLMVIMLVAIIQKHMGNGFHFMQGGFEFQLVLLTLAYMTYLLSGGWWPGRECAVRMLWPEKAAAPAEGGMDAPGEG